MKKKLYVVVRSISFGNSVGGMEKAASEHITEMARIGYDIVLISPSEKTIGSPPNGVSMINVPWPKWDRYKILMTMGAAYYTWCNRVANVLSSKLNENDIVHFHGASAGVLKFIPSHIKGKVFTVVNPHGMEEFGSGSFLRVVNRAFTKRLIRKSILANTVIATDESIINIIKMNLYVSDDKISLIQNSIDVQRLRDLVTNSNRVKEDGEEGIVSLVSIGRIEFNKGYDLLAGALSLYSKQFPDTIIKWTHYGRGKKSTELREIARKNNVNLTIIENASDVEVQSALAYSDVFVQPSRYEGSSLTTLEAMAHGCLIVATPVGGIPDKIKNRMTGFLCQAPDAESIKASIREALLFKDKNIVRNNAFEMADSVYDIKASTRKYNELYSSHSN